MNTDERQLISDLFERFRSHGPVEKDRDAEQLIISLARQNADAGYMLVQTVLVQEQVMQQQQQQVEDLQARVQELEAMSQRGAPQQSANNGGFLGGGGIFGGRGQPQPTQRTSVPPMGRPAAQPAPASSSPWGRTSAAPQQQGGYAPQQGGYAPAQAAPAAGGGFMRSAMATAAGVAGGMLAANAIGNMMRGDSSSQQSASNTSGSNDPGNSNAGFGSSGDVAAENSAQDAAQDAAYYENNDPGNDPGTTEAASDNSWDGGGDVEL
jgi:uncharacterized protein